MLRALLLYLSNTPGLGRAMDRLPLSRRLVRRFVAGTTPDAAFAVIERLQGARLLSAVTYLGENVLTEAAARRAADVYLDLLDEIKRRDLPCVPSLKLTPLGLDRSETLCRENLERILERAQAGATLSWIDMESSAYTDRTLALYAAVRPRYPSAACVIQAYLRRRAAGGARELGVPPEKFEIQMLYGIRHDLHAPIRDQGLRLRVLVPFGEEWYGYFVRRLAERPANLLFLLKNLVRG